MRYVKNMKDKENNMKIKKTNLFYALLLLTTIFSNHSMEPMEQPKSEEPTWNDYTAYVGAILLGDAELITDESSPLSQLSLEMRSKIVSFLLTGKNTNNLQTCAKTINALAQVNKDLNELINDPHFCLQLIKRLAQRFNCSDFTAVAALKTKEARRRLLLQTKLYLICSEYLHTITCNDLPQDIDLEFTYDEMSFEFQFLHAFLTPLMMASIRQNIPTMLCLLQKGSKVNQKTNGGKTTLILITECLYMEPNTIKPNTIKVIQTLLNAGANPEIADDNGNTALTIAQQIGNKEIINLMQNAIQRKPGKK
jgi:hypothetical protein